MAVPAAAPNTGMFFDPQLHFNVGLAVAAAANTVAFNAEIEYLVEFRGSLQ